MLKLKTIGVIAQDSLVKKMGEETVTCFSVFINQPNKEAIFLKCAFLNDDSRKKELWKFLKRGKLVDLVLCTGEQAKIIVRCREFTYIESIEIIEREELCRANAV
ncbi:MAG: hypothetical protein IPJ74_09385 [Saprospiraceae bacterium]|nr:hypothetical protein [Saprospiraceae bacterium]